MNVGDSYIRTGRFHPIIVDGIDLLERYGLMPKMRPVISPPSVKTSSIEVPGSFGMIDTSEILTGYPLYGNRSGSWEFIVITDHSAFSGTETTPDYWDNWRHSNSQINTIKSNARYGWLNTYNSLVAFLHGKVHKIVLGDSLYPWEDDSPNKNGRFYYQGRLKVDGWNTGNKYSTVKISYDLEPYRYEFATVSEQYPDIFKIIDIDTTEAIDLFPDEVLNGYLYMADNSYGINPDDESLTNKLISATSSPSQPCHPTISVWGGPIEIQFVNEELSMSRVETYPEGEHEVYRFTLSNLYPELKKKIKFFAKGTGAIKIDWRNRTI